MWPRSSKTHQPLIGDAIVKDAPGLMLVVEKFPWANTEDVTEEVDEGAGGPASGSGRRRDGPHAVPAGDLHRAGGRQSLVRPCSSAPASCSLVFFVFLANWRTALIGCVAILASLFAAGAVLYVRGVTMNLIILAGLLIGLGAIIDDAIVDVESIVRRLRQARREGSGQSAANVIREAAFETRSPLLYATVVLLLAVVPVLFLGGVTGAFSQPLAFSYLLAMLTSLLVALTVTPALSLLLLRDAGPSPHRLTRHAPAGWRLPACFGVARGHTAPGAMLVAGVVMVAGLASLPLLRQESLLPSFKETDLVVRLEGSSSASHPAMSRIMTLASRELRAIPGVRNVSAHVGRAIMSDRRTNINSGELWVSLDPAADYDTTVAAVKRVVAGYPGLSPEVLTYLQAKFREELSGTDESLVVRVYGEDLRAAGARRPTRSRRSWRRSTASRTRECSIRNEMPTLEIEVNIEKAKQYGLKPGDVRRAATSLVSGIEVGSLFEEQKVFDVMVWGAPEVRHSLTSVRRPADRHAGGRRQCRLQDVADVRIVPGATAIHRDAVARRIDVTRQGAWTRSWRSSPPTSRAASSRSTSRSSTARSCWESTPSGSRPSSACWPWRLPPPSGPSCCCRRSSGAGAWRWPSS